MKELFESHKFKLESLTYMSPTNKILKEHLQNLDKFNDMYSSYYKLIERLNIAYPNLNNTIAELSKKNEKIFQSLGFNNSELEKVINNLKNNNIVLEDSLWSKVSAIIKDSKIDYLKNFDENKFNFIQDNFKNIGVNSEFVTISFFESIDANEIDLTEDKINELSIETSNYLRDLFIKSNFIVNIITNYLTKNPSIKLSTVVLAFFIKEIISSCISVYVENRFNGEDNKNITIINNNHSENEIYTINTDDVLLKNENSNNSRTIAKLKLNTEIIVLKNNRKWVFVFVKNDQIISGWIRKEFIDFPEK